MRAFKSVLKFFASFSHPLTFLVLDNESSSDLTALFRSQQPPLPFQHVPSLVHRANKAERAVQTAKKHLISVLSSAHITSPPDRWPKLLASAELSLNHLRPWKKDPTLSAWHGLRGTPHDFDAQPLHPPGQLVVVHDAPGKRPSWARHGVRGFYLSPAFSHYRSHVCFIPKTGATRISNTLDHFPDPLFPFEDVSPDAEPLPDPTSSRPAPAFDGLDLIARQFVDPDIGLCTVTRGASPVFLQPHTGNLTPGPRLSPGWHPCLQYRTPTDRLETSTVAEVARWVRDQPPPDPIASLPDTPTPALALPAHPTPPPAPVSHRWSPPAGHQPPCFP